jgi:hypothetical protein
MIITSFNPEVEGKAMNTGNRKVIEKLQEALEDFMADHRRHAQTLPPPDNEIPLDDPGCGCRDCNTAGELLGRI